MKSYTEIIADFFYQGFGRLESLISIFKYFLVNFYSKTAPTKLLREVN